MTALSQISPEARIGAGVTIGPFCEVHGNVIIEDDVTIGSHCVIGHQAPDADAGPLVIGCGSQIRSHSVLYEGSTFGPQMETGHRVTLREGLEVGTNFRVGTLCDLQGDSKIGNYVRLHSNVFAGKLTRLDDFVWVFPHAVFTNDQHPPSDGHHVGVHVERFAVVAACATILAGIRIGEGALVGAHSFVRQDVEPGMVVAGVPAQERAKAADIKLPDGSPAYPWRRHFTRGYPDELIEIWNREEY